MTNRTARLAVRDALREGRSTLSRSTPTPDLDARVLLQHCTGRDHAWLLAHCDEFLEAAPIKHFRELCDRRRDGCPVAYLTGRREFWSVEFELDEHVLIPRPETEHLVQRALESISPQEELLVCDLGTGSGAVAVAIAAERPGVTIVAMDISPRATRLAQRNAQRHSLDNVIVVQGNWTAPLRETTYDVLVSNPPYIRSGHPCLSQGDLRSEPRLALESGHDGLDAIREIIDTGTCCLKPGGRLLLEHGYDQGAAVASLLMSAGYVQIRGFKDHAGHDRVTTGVYAGRTHT